MTIDQVGSAIRNHISDGLKGEIPNMSYSKEQLIDEAFLVRNSLIMKYSMQAKFDFDSMFQTWDSIPIKEIDLSNSRTPIRSGICRNYILLPTPSTAFDKKSVAYIGDVSKETSFKIYWNTNWNAHKHKLKISNKPFVYVDTSIREDGKVIAYLYNLNEVKDLKYITVRMIAENPMSFIESEDCCTELIDRPFPAPSWMLKEIIDIVTNTYVTQYRKLNIPDAVLANKQRDINA